MNYSVFVADEAIEDIFSLVKYVHRELRNPKAAEKLYQDLKNLIFYIINDEEKRVYILRVIKELMNWKKILRRGKTYHFAKWR